LYFRASVQFSPDYLPFGPEYNPSGSGIYYLFTGKLIDSVTGLYYFGARYYDPESGRFITEDSKAGSLQDPQTMNRYVYARDNPLMYLDPSGNMFTYNGGNAGGSTDFHNPPPYIPNGCGYFGCGTGNQVYKPPQPQTTVATPGGSSVDSCSFSSAGCSAGQQSSSSSICSKTDFSCWFIKIYLSDPDKLGQMAIDAVTILDLLLGAPVFTASDILKVLTAQALGDLSLAIEDAVVNHNPGGFINALASFSVGVMGDMIANGISFSQSMMLIASGLIDVAGVAGYDEMRAAVASVVAGVDIGGFLADIGVEGTQYGQS